VGELRGTVVALRERAAAGSGGRRYVAGARLWQAAPQAAVGEAEEAFEEWLRRAGLTMHLPKREDSTFLDRKYPTPPPLPTAPTTTGSRHGGISS